MELLVVHGNTCYFIIYMYDSLAFVSHVVYFLSGVSWLQRTDIPFLFCIFEVKITDFSFICQRLMWTAKY
jgi:hypothetical protein